MLDKEYKDLSIREFTKAAKGYEGNHAGLYAMCKKDYPDILAEIEKAPFSNLLDIGCGPAPMISLLSEKYPDKHYVGIDLTPKMIDIAKDKAIPNAEFIVGDAESLPFEENSFDLAICSMSFHHYPNPQAFFNSVHRVLKPNGRLILRDMTGSKLLIGFTNKIELPLANRFGHGDVRCYSLDEVRAMCEKANLHIEILEQRKGLRLHMVARKLK